jgi:hypothetical protein
MFSLQVKWPGYEAEHSPYLLANLRIHGATAPLPNRPPWPAEGQIYFHFYLVDNVILNQPVMKTPITAIFMYPKGNQKCYNV